MAANPKIIVVGGGLAGLAATIKIAEMGGHVDLFSIVPVKRSHSVCAQGGINAAKNLKGEGDSTWQHFDDTVYGGDFLGNQPPIKGMCEAAGSFQHLRPDVMLRQLDLVRAAISAPGTEQAPLRGAPPSLQDLEQAKKARKPAGTAAPRRAATG